MQNTYHINMCRSMQTLSRTRMDNKILSISHTNMGHIMQIFLL